MAVLAISLHEPKNHLYKPFCHVLHGSWLCFCPERLSIQALREQQQAAAFALETLPSVDVVHHSMLSSLQSDVLTMQVDYLRQKIYFLWAVRCFSSANALTLGVFAAAGSIQQAV